MSMLPALAYVRHLADSDPASSPTPAPLTWLREGLQPLPAGRPEGMAENEVAPAPLPPHELKVVFKRPRIQ
jgi:hypothetical protein